MPGRRLALAAALLGWMFDGLEMGLFPLVARPALGELLGTGATPESIGRAFAAITALFLVGAATGGVAFGWLGDRVGRVRALSMSVLLYAGCSGASAFATEPWHLAALRFAGALGMGGEWALGVALVMELYPESSRVRLAAMIGAAGNLGYALVGAVALSLHHAGHHLPTLFAQLAVPDAWAEVLLRADQWRLLMLVGTGPAVLTVFIRLFVPESPRWLAQPPARDPHDLRDVLMMLVGTAVALGIVPLWFYAVPLAARIPLTLLGLVAVTTCYLAPTRARLRRSPTPTPVVGRMLLGAALSAVPLLATWAGIMWMYNWVSDLTGQRVPEARATVQIASSVGAALGSVAGAVAAAALGRRRVYATLCVLAAATLYGFYALNTEYNTAFVASSFAVGAVCASFYGWLPLTLPELFPTRFRASGQGFAFNFGRIVAAVGTLQTGSLLAHFDNDYARACSLIAAVYLVGFGLVFLLPNTKTLPD